MFTLLSLLACGNDYSAVKGSTCDGVAQANEDRVDGPFDADGDGAFDAANPDCAETYAAQFLDCDDTDPAVNPLSAEVACDGADNDCDAATPDGDDLDADGFTACEDCVDSDPAVHPGASEVACNGLDDDCAVETPDGPDADGDGVAACTDCDDADPLAYPENAETCDNGRDDDCDGSVDEECASDYSDDWLLDQDVSYTCTFGLVSIDFGEVTILDRNPSLTVTANGAGYQPGSLRGSFTSGTTFEVSRSIRGSCTENYSMTGTFTSANTFEATFTAEFVGGSACYDCTDQSWTVTGAR
jgi:hypothetical protein